MPGSRALGLKPGQSLEIRSGVARLETAIVATPVRPHKRCKGVVAVPDAVLPALTAEQVRHLEQARR
jgi:hypothetical protein